VALVFTGVVAVISPPRSLPGRPLCIVILLMTGWVIVSSVLPTPLPTAARWIGGIAQLDLYPAISAQPRHSLERFCYYLCALVWLLLVMDAPLARLERNKAIERIHVLLTCLAITVILGVLLKFQHPSTWGTHRFSFFPNHNQTGAVLAIGGILAMGWMVRCMRQRSWRMILYMLSFSVFSFAIFLGMSRSAVIFVIAGSCLMILTVFESRNPRFYLKLGVPFGFVLLALFLVYGGQLVDEFTYLLRDGGVREELRVRIFADTLRMIAAFPVLGVGLGNFRFFFPQFQDSADTPQLILHPESDFLWVWSELGLPGIILLAAGMLLLLVRLEPHRAWHTRSSRLAGVVSVALFMMMGLFEVSGHRLGTALLAVLVYGIAQPRSVERFQSQWLPVVVRLSGVGCLLMAGFWIAGIRAGHPTTTEEVFAHLDKPGRTLQDLDELDRWVARLPLAARLHHLYGWRSMADGETGVAQASRSFETFQALEPKRWKQLVEHGAALYPYQMERALEYWDQAIFRAGVDDEVLAFRLVMRNVTPEDYPSLRELVAGSTQLRFAYYAGLRTERTMYSREMGLELAMNPNLSGFRPDQKRAMLWQFAEYQGSAILTRMEQRFPGLTSDHWMIAALVEAESGHFDRAVQLAVDHLPEPPMVDLTGGRSLSVIRAHYLMDSMDPLKVIALVQRQKQDLLFRDALIIIEVATRKGVRHPYLDYQVAWLLHQLGQHEDSWKLFRERIRGSISWE
jgi:hypothetical protein